MCYECLPRWIYVHQTPARSPWRSEKYAWSPGPRITDRQVLTSTCVLFVHNHLAVSPAQHHRHYHHNITTIFSLQWRACNLESCKTFFRICVKFKKSYTHWFYWIKSVEQNWSGHYVLIYFITIFYPNNNVLFENCKCVSHKSNPRKIECMIQS